VENIVFYYWIKQQYQSKTIGRITSGPCPFQLV
jgi:hypothetical protein